MWKWLLGLFVGSAVVCGGAGYYVYQSGQYKKWMEAFGPTDKPLEVRIEPARRGTLVRTVSAPGTVEPRTVVKISAQVSSRIVGLPFHEGDHVKEGDVVVRLDARDLQAALESVQASKQSQLAQLDGAKAALAQAKNELDRQEKLFASKDIPESELQQTRSDYLRAEAAQRAAEHGIEIADANIRRAERDLENTVIRSPIDGTIIKLDMEVGEQVLGTFNNAGTVIMQIADMAVIAMKAKVDESNIAVVKQGQHAVVYINAYPDRKFEGTIEQIKLQRQADRDGTGYFETEVLLNLPDGMLLRSGLNANTDIAVETFYDVVRIPSQAVLDRRKDELPKAVADSNQYVAQDKTFTRVVYRLVDGKAVVTPVSAGPSDLTQTVVLGGLDDGDMVVTGPFKILQTLKHDQKIAPEGTSDKDKKSGEGAKAGAVAGGEAGKQPNKGG